MVVIDVLNDAGGRVDQDVSALRHLLELPPEEFSVEPLQRLLVPRSDLEVEHRIAHLERSLIRSRSRYSYRHPREDGKPAVSA